jgi:hypothetical protein
MPKFHISFVFVICAFVILAGVPRSGSALFVEILGDAG